MVLVLLPASVFARACTDGAVSLRGDWGKARFAVEVADTDRTRARGLMFRQTMPQSEGMLFVYAKPGPAVFWMKNTLIPLDMIFLDETGLVTHVHYNARPHDETAIFGGEKVLAVLELNAGVAASLGVAPGTELRHPAFQQDVAIWPC